MASKLIIRVRPELLFRSSFQPPLQPRLTEIARLPHLPHHSRTYYLETLSGMANCNLHIETTLESLRKDRNSLLELERAVPG